jgi:hypothetical protein
MQGFDHDALIEAEVPETASLGLVERCPIDGADASLRPNGKSIKTDHIRVERRVHCCD